MKSKLTLLLLTAITIIACSTTGTIFTQNGDQVYNSFDDEDKIYIMDDADFLPAESTLVGEMDVTGATNLQFCDPASVLEKTREKARENGANIVLLNKFKPVRENCHYINATFYRNTTDRIMILFDQRAPKFHLEDYNGKSLDN